MFPVIRLPHVPPSRSTPVEGIPDYWVTVRKVTLYAHESR